MEQLQQQLLQWFDLPADSSTLTLAQQQMLLNKHEPFFRLVINDKVVGTDAETWFKGCAEETLQAYADSLDTKTAFSAPIWQKVYNAILFTSLVGHRLVFNRVPKLSLKDVRLTIGDDHRVSNLFISSDTPFFSLDDTGINVDSQQELDQKLVEVILELSTPLTQFYKSQRVNPRVYWGNILYACNLAFSKLTHEPIAEDNSLDTSLLQEWQSAVFEQALPKGGQLNKIKEVSFNGFKKIYVRRETCCLKYKIEGKAKCTTCNLHSEEEQTELVINKLKKLLQTA
ncbi:hypothetical protein JCM19241_5673 [Vibrio ishigakensis]|uniref:Ferric siderophore reductase C-terminal domain-containing protein n=1 Tax=Vibrio ishigakensis TaxID=1481914 RepID=A0A0B8QC39_9VIBR|nr:hypothetical protein JCM19241_5673 [Vibrio ishigakensis]